MTLHQPCWNVRRVAFGRLRRLLPLGTAIAAAGAGCRTVAAANDAPPAEPRLEAGAILMPANSPNLRSVTTALVGNATATEPNHLVGRLIWDEDLTVRVFTPIAGRVSRVLVSTGQRVSAGQTLALISSGEFGQSQADARRAAADLVFANRTLARQRDLLSHGVVAAKDVESAEADSARAQAEKLRADARLAMLGGDSATVIQGFQLKAPLGGLVVERNMTPGQEIRPDQMLASAPQLMAPLFVITDPTRLWVELDVPERDLPHLVAGQSMTIRLLARPDRPVRGRIILIGSAVDPATRTIKVRGIVENPTLELKSEMLVSADVTVPVRMALGVPAKAVFLEGDKHLVFIEERTGIFRHAEVTAGPERDGAVPVTAGLKTGDRIVVEGSLMLNQLYHALRPAPTSADKPAS